MAHYFSKQPDIASQEKVIEVYALEQTYQFVVDDGVFSKNALDFGSKLLMETIDLNDLTNGDVLDVGCGWGAMSIPLAIEHKERKFDLVDVNERALHLSEVNAQSYHLENVKVFESNIYDQVERNDYAAIISNPPIRAGKDVVHAILEGAYNHLKEEGSLTVVIQKKQGAPSAKKKMEDVFGNVEELERKKGYWILQSRKEGNQN